MNTYTIAVHGTMLDDLAKIIHYVCCPYYSSTIDGTHAMAEAEAIILPIVTKDWNITELLVRLKLFKKKVTAEEIDNHPVEGKFTRLHLKLKNWLESKQDQASTFSLSNQPPCPPSVIIIRRCSSVPGA